MTHTTTTFAVADPRTFDGDPYEVAERAIAQLQGLAALIDQQIPATLLMVRNAEMERNLALHKDADAAGFDGSLQGQRWQEARDRLLAFRNDLNLLKKVASYNPRATIR